jgi:hypothetical protein
MTTFLTKPCAQCPWRLANQGKRHANGFYTKANLRRLWNQVRQGGAPQSCHLTDPTHPDHVANGCKPGSTPQECPGSIILIQREFARAANEKHEISNESVATYLRWRKRGITKKGFLYWALQRMQFANVPIMGGKPLPKVDIKDETVGLPEYLEESP